MRALLREEPLHHPSDYSTRSVHFNGGRKLFLVGIVTMCYELAHSRDSKSGGVVLCGFDRERVFDSLTIKH